MHSPAKHPSAVVRTSHVPHSLGGLNAWSPAGGAVWRGVKPHWRKYLTREGFEITQPPPSSRLPVCPFARSPICSFCFVLVFEDVSWQLLAPPAFLAARVNTFHDRDRRLPFRNRKPRLTPPMARFWPSCLLTAGE